MRSGSAVTRDVADIVLVDDSFAALLPAGVHRSLPGGWHGVADEDLAPVLRDFLGARRP